MNYVVDTHALLWFIEGSPRLSVAARDALSTSESSLVVPAICLAELTYLYDRGKAQVDLRRVREEILSARNTKVYPLDEVVVELMPRELEIHDAIIVATTRVYSELLGVQTALITRDLTLQQAGIVATLW